MHGQRRKEAFYRPLLGGLLYLFLISPLIWSQARSFPPRPLTAEEISEARRLLEVMKKDPRGPYLRIRWFCRDGTIHPPAGTPCRDRGGGVQHAEFNEGARRLAGLGIHVGTILQTLSFEEFLDAAANYDRLHQLILEQYLIEADDGWVLRRARYYRGARQIEDEERKGEEFLLRLLEQPGWLEKNFLLAFLLTQTLPHPSPHQGSTREVRRLATELAELEPAWQDLRVKIHSFPGPEDLQLVQTRLADPGLSPAVREKLLELRGSLARQYDPQLRWEALTNLEKGLPEDWLPALRRLRKTLAADNASQALTQLGHLAERVREEVTRVKEAPLRLRLMQLNLVLQQSAFSLLSSQPLNHGGNTRREHLRLLRPMLQLAYGHGLLSRREMQALQEELQSFSSRQRATVLEYKNSLNYLSRSLDWARTGVREYFHFALQRYQSVEPKAANFPDAVLRASPLLHLSQVLETLQQDADRLLGTSHLLFGQAVTQGIRGLNPGVALGTLQLALDGRPSSYGRENILVLPETTAQLHPMAGVLSLDAGNLLSHIQLLARNLSIPNAMISTRILNLIRPFQGRQVFYAVSPLGRVVLKEAGQLTPAEEALLRGASPPSRIRLDTRLLRLEVTRPLPLEGLRTSDSGRTVGPKAANLGELSRLFPGQVGRGVALPFGMFHRHISQPTGNGTSLRQQLEQVYARAAAMEAAGTPEEEIDAFLLPQLERIQRDIILQEWDPEMRRLVEEAIRKTFPDLSRGVFVRSDTNVEDLPQFSGAGLNLTLPHLRTLPDILEGIKKVWASPFQERAYRWRRAILQNQGNVYPSVLLLESIPSERSGVLISAGLEIGEPDDFTIVTAEGVGGAVEGEAAETILVKRDGRVILLAQAKCPYRRVLSDSPRGGISLVPSQRPESLLNRRDIALLLQVIQRWQEQVGSSPVSAWDLEFGFVGEKLWLFQIRPFVRYRSRQLTERLRQLDVALSQRSGDLVLLSESPRGEESGR